VVETLGSARHIAIDGVSLTHSEERAVVDAAFAKLLGPLVALPIYDWADRTASRV